MRKLVRKLLCMITLTTFFSVAHAQDGTLKIDADLILHPNQLSNFFAMAAKQINDTANWSWSSFAFSQPYNTQWEQVQAQGPFTVQFDTSNLANQEVGFTLNWPNPTLTAGTFTLNDTVTTITDGIRIIFHLNASCSHLSMNINGGNWVVTGKMHYALNGQNFAVTTDSFQLQSSASVTPQVNLGQCQGQAGTLQQIQQAIATMSGNQTWLQNILQQGFQNWAQNEMTLVGTQLLSAQSSPLTSNMGLQWQPSTLTQLGGGVLWVAGALVLDKKGAPLTTADSVPRNYTVKTLNGVTESAFLMNNASLQHVLNYMSANGELLYRVNSNTIPAFNDLMNSWFEKFFVWPDLMSFANDTAFYFDLTTSSSPQLGQGWMLDGGGSGFNISVPMLAHQWAPAQGKYLPYVDFSAPIDGQLNAVVANGKLNLQLNANPFDLTAQFRSEFAQTRPVNASINASLIGSSAQSYLNSTPFSTATPSWAIDSAISMQITDIQMWSETMRLPLNFFAK